MQKLTLLGGAFFALALSGCIDMNDYKSAPVQVSTSQGIVTCQLYKKSRVLWDEAIAVPSGMSIATGDKICREEGQKRIGRKL